MNHPRSPQRIVVGIDGSHAAINAAKWAVAEATSRDIPLRLIYAMPERKTDAPSDDSLLDVECGESALRTACAALHAATADVKVVETDLVNGSPVSALIDESRYGAMLCVGLGGDRADRPQDHRIDCPRCRSRCSLPRSDRPRQP